MTHNHQFTHSGTEEKSADTNTNGPEIRPGAEGLSRRSMLKSLAASAAVSVLPSALSGANGLVRSGLAEGRSEPPAPVKNPAWFGFNLLEYFSTDPDWMKYFPYKNDGLFQEDDFRWMRDWGFNFVRLPMDYRFWTDAERFDEHQREAGGAHRPRHPSGRKIRNPRQHLPAPGAGRMHSGRHG